MKLNHWVVLVLGSTLTALAIAKLPPPAPMTDEQKAKAEETKAKAADAAKKAAADDSRYQDKVAARYFMEMKALGKTVASPTWVPPPVVVVAQPSSSESHGQKQAVAPKTQDTTTSGAAKPSSGATNAKPTPVKG